MFFKELVEKLYLFSKANPDLDCYECLFHINLPNVNLSKINNLELFHHELVINYNYKKEYFNSFKDTIGTVHRSNPSITFSNIGDKKWN